MRLPYALSAATVAAAPVLATSLPADASWKAASSAGNAKGKATTLPTGSTPSTSVSGSTVTPAWSALTVATGVAVRGYRVTRYNASTGDSANPGGTCAAVVTTTSCQDTSVPDGRWKYAVQAVHGTNWVGTTGSQSASVLVSTVPGTAGVTFPVGGTKYNNANQWNVCTPNPGFCGTASAAGGTALTAVRVSLRKGTGNYWNPATAQFDSSTELLFAVTSGLSSWKVTFAFTSLPNNSTLTLRAVTTDDAGGSTSASVTFTT
jgi:hypothetical protein